MLLNEILSWVDCDLVLNSLTVSYFNKDHNNAAVWSWLKLHTIKEFRSRSYKWNFDLRGRDLLQNNLTVCYFHLDHSKYLNLIWSNTPTEPLSKISTINFRLNLEFLRLNFDFDWLLISLVMFGRIKWIHKQRYIRSIFYRICEPMLLVQSLF